MLFSTWCKRVAKRYEAHKTPRPKGEEGWGERGERGERGEEEEENVDPKEEETRRKNVRRERRRREMPRISRDPDARDARLALLGGPILGRRSTSAERSALTVRFTRFRVSRGGSFA